MQTMTARSSAPEEPAARNGMQMEAYYRERAPRYDLVYRSTEWQADIAWLKKWVAERTARRSVLEVAAGTGFWTAAAAPRAKAIVATDYNPETLAVAMKRGLGPHVTLLAADAYALPKFDCVFDVGMAHLWWSHVDTRIEQRFLCQFASRLEPGAELLMIDQRYLDGRSMPSFRRDRAGNRYELRTLENGHVFQVIKNYPTPDQLRASMGNIFEKVRITSLRYFWALRARLPK